MKSVKKEVVDLLEAFCKSFDEKDWKGMKNCLTDSIYVDYSSFRGKLPSFQTSEEYVALRKQGLQQLETIHINYNYLIEVFDNENSICICDFIIKRFTRDKKDYFHSYGNYVYCLKRVGSKWKISSIKQAVDKNEGNPEIHGALKEKSTSGLE